MGRMMLRLLAIFLLIVGTAQAEVLSGSKVGSRDRPTWNPPARYDHPYDGKLIEHRLPQQAVRRYCAKLFEAFDVDLTASMHQRGCSVRRPGFCVIVYIDRPYGLATPEAVKRHELGHCNGWPADHSD